MKAITSLALAALGLAIPAAAMAGANKTWVSGTGKDTGTCPITAPCASFQYAVNQTAAGGEVDVKDAGGYGTITITKAITIAADGVLASISVPAGGTGITITASATDAVTLRGLTIDGHGIGKYGIMATQALHLLVRDTTVQGAVGAGIAFIHSGSVSTYLTLSHVTASNNGVGVQTTGGYNSESTISDSTFSHNATGIAVGNGNATIVNCLVDSNSQYGVNNSDALVITNSIFNFNASDIFDYATSLGDNLFRDFGSDHTLGTGKRS